MWQKCLRNTFKVFTDVLSLGLRFKVLGEKFGH